jgi:hypothetical protein
MREKVETQLKPMLEMLRAELLPNGRLLAGGMELVIGHYEETFRVLDERKKKLCWYEFCLTPELFLAMDIHPFLGEVHPPIMALGTPEVTWQYVDVAEEAGTPPELCVLDKFMLGALLSNEMPKADFIVTASAPCDSSRIGYQMFEQLSDCPFYRLDAPVEDSREAHAYYASEIRKLIGFLEEQTGNRFDGDRLREVCEESNRATEALLERFELFAWLRKVDSLCRVLARRCARSRERGTGGGTRGEAPSALVLRARYFRFRAQQLDRGEPQVGRDHGLAFQLLQRGPH